MEENLNYLKSNGNIALTKDSAGYCIAKFTKNVKGISLSMNFKSAYGMEDAIKYLTQKVKGEQRLLAFLEGIAE